jgi:hypothetical protein
MGNTENQRAVFDFLVAHYKSQERFTKAELEAQTTWRGKTFSTYWTKLYEKFTLASGTNSFRVSDPFRPFISWSRFQRHVTQNRDSSEYTLLRYDSLLIFEFFMPLTNETHLRTALDALFYKDSIVSRLKACERQDLSRVFPLETNEIESHYFDRLCDWLASRFQGYSVTTVSGRFRAHDLMTIRDAAKIEEDYDRYLVDETTAIVRFIFPCGNPVRRGSGSVIDFDDPETDSTDLAGIAGRDEAKKIRWFFNALFVQSIIQVVNGEAEIWMVESGLRNRLHIWRVESE